MKQFFRSLYVGEEVGVFAPAARSAWVAAKDFVPLREQQRKTLG